MKNYFYYMFLLIIISLFIFIKPVSSIAQCTQDSDCGVKQYCAYKDKPELANYCKPGECTQNSHCPSGECVTQKSGKDYYKCVKCTNDSHCSGAQGKCKINNNNELYNECVECLKEHDCGSGNHCVDNRCYVCTQDSHCSGDKDACLLNRSNPDGRCVDCTTNSHCTLNQICDTSTYTCKAKFEQPEPQIDPDKYKIDKYKGKSPKKIQTTPELDKKYIDQPKAPKVPKVPKVDTKKVSPKD
nr:hypothetical protein [Candidatus Dadabacteria bacterium]NIS07599.1 hypothetical protein [Candidatus Dadabacteria bacterium]NIY21233.1 hypothetical protein [Candidatus Dadabacteria bacterium]